MGVDAFTGQLNMLPGQHGPQYRQEPVHYAVSAEDWAEHFAQERRAPPQQPLGALVSLPPRAEQA